MRFWIREMAGWVLVLIGLVFFYLCFQFLTSKMIIEAGPLAVIGIFVFRGGIHLLKVAAAAQVCLHARQEADRQISRPRSSERKEPWPTL